jgi:RND family efflux transporter MFP subunit
MNIHDTNITTRRRRFGIRLTQPRELHVKYTWILAALVLMATACDNTGQTVTTDVEIPVSVEEVAMKPIETFVVTTGTVTSTKDAVVKSEAAGFYKLEANPRTGRPYALGDAVKKDQVIITLENPETENSVRIETHKLALDSAQREYEKQKSLYEKGGVTLSELTNAEKSFISSRYDYESAQMQLAKLKITAPFDGVLVDIEYKTPGIKIASGDELFEIMNYSTLTMDVNFPANLQGQIVVGQQVRVMNYTVPDKVLTGTLSQVSPALDPDTRTFKAVVIVNNPDLVLRPGMFVKAEIVTDKRESAVVVPKDCIVSMRSRKTVFVVDRGIATERPIETGISNPDEVEIVKGPDVGERLVVKGFETLRNGSKVSIQQ